MAHIKRFKAKRDLKLDCGHTAKVGETFAVSQHFTCEEDIPQFKPDPKPTEPKAAQSR